MRRSPSHLLGILTALAVLNWASVASAGTITFQNILGTWSDVQGGTGVTMTGNGTATAEVRWGVPAETDKSGYQFAAVPNPGVSATLPPSPTPDFILGTFTHFNQPINSGTSITGIRLSIDADVLLDGNPLGAYTFVYDFAHTETPNGDDPCADGGAHGVGVNENGCADHVVTNYNLLSDSFQIGPDLYTLDIRGFELLDTTKVLSFWTKEKENNQAYILGRVALTSDVIGDTVPEPASLMLLCTGLIGTAGALRRRRKK